MRTYIRAALFLAIQAVLIISSSDAGPAALLVSPGEQLTRIRFDIAAFDENKSDRELLAETIVEGPAGTDFEINLEGQRFRLHAKFTNDVLDGDSLQMRADLRTRRFYGRSEKDLPLYEEDVQKETLQLTFNEKLVLLPFGDNQKSQASGQLRIEITPTKVRPAVVSSSQPLDIKIVKPSPANLILVNAWKIPHRFNYTASLLENGQVVATGKVDSALIEEPEEIVLTQNSQANRDVINNPLIVNLMVARYLRGRPLDQVAVEFGVRRYGNPTEPIASRWAGVGNLGSQLRYDLTDYYLNSIGKKYELALSVNLAPGENAD